MKTISKSTETRTKSSRLSQRARHKPTHEEIAKVAYGLYEQEGKPDGKALEHWFNAEAMIENNLGQGLDHTEHNFFENYETD